MITIHARTSLYSNSFLPSFIRDWNNLPRADRNADSVDSFKRHLSHGRVSVPKCFTLATDACRPCTHGFELVAVLSNTTFTRRTLLTLHFVTADVLTLKIQNISSSSVTYIGTTDWCYTTL